MTSALPSARLFDTWDLFLSNPDDAWVLYTGVALTGTVCVMLLCKLCLWVMARSWSRGHYQRTRRLRQVGAWVRLCFGSGVIASCVLPFLSQHAPRLTVSMVLLVTMGALVARYDKRRVTVQGELRR